MTLLEIKNLSVIFQNNDESFKAVDGLNLRINKGETVALVGESGSGKTISALSILRLVPEPGRIRDGKIVFQNQDLLLLHRKAMQAVRGKKIGLVMQDPLSALNPVIRVGEQLAEVLRFHFHYSPKKARSEAETMMQIVQLEQVEKVFVKYPHELSGGQRQRMLIAIALACRPDLLIADEPTTALDVTIQSQILALLKKLKHQFHLSLLLITHDLGIVAEMADKVAVMYAGQIMEQASTADLFGHPLHPYTQLLLSAMPKVLFEPNDKINKFEIKSERKALNTDAACHFHRRCPFAQAQCTQDVPEKSTTDGRFLRCIK
ncbi:ABC transporter ATP-binding protein [candidate division KSB1 bacterium]|nr:ABC transporter ATP-binding protein [candidate division KSB1 bacterium]RQW01821.1 MAG: ABC transporter ATP-binding protein [candidate division KSB1 bacterium]